MHVKGHAMFKFRCFWNCSFIAHMFLAWFLQSWKPTRFFIVAGWPMILISFKMSGAEFTLIMASSHQSISFLLVENIWVTPRKSRCCSYSKSSAFVECWRFPGILKFKDSLLTVAANGTWWLARLCKAYLSFPVWRKARVTLFSGEVSSGLESCAWKLGHKFGAFSLVPQDVPFLVLPCFFVLGVDDPQRFWGISFECLPFSKLNNWYKSHAQFFWESYDISRCEIFGCGIRSFRWSSWRSSISCWQSSAWQGNLDLASNWWLGWGRWYPVSIKDHGWVWNIYIYIIIYMYTCIHIGIYIYIYIKG